MNPVRCLYPKIGLTIEADGGVKLCSSSSVNLFNLKDKNQNIKDLWNSTLYQEIRNSHTQGIFPEACNVCQRAEQKGEPSKREYFLNSRLRKYGDDKVENLLTEKANNIRFISVAFSNDCNLACSMCSGFYSQSWQRKSFQPDDKRHLPFKLTDQHLMELIELSANCDSLLIKGGEPFMEERLPSFLEEVFSKTDSPFVYIQTNGTFFNQEISKLLNKYPINIGISIDGVDKTYEWIRGFPFSKIKENIESFLKVTKGEVWLNYTHSIFNLYNLSPFLNFYQGLREKFPNKVFLELGSIARQPHNDPKALPKNLRESILSSLNEEEYASCLGFETMKNYLSLPSLSLKEQSISKSWIMKLEETRGVTPSRQEMSFHSWLESP